MAILPRLGQTWSGIFASRSHEEDAGFRDVIQRLCKRGLVTAGVLGVVGALANLGANVLTGSSLALKYGTPGTIVVWDKLAILLLGIALVGLAQTRSGPRWGRVIGAAVALVAGIAIMTDDFARGTMVASNYLGLLMLVVVVALPYRAEQAFGMVFVTFGAYLWCSWYFSGVYGVPWSVSSGQLVFLIIVFILCVGISAVLYNIRFEQYQARRKAEQLEHLKSRFVANVTHEFRTPLSLILGPVEDALSDAYGPLGERLRKQLQLLQRSGLRLHHLINQLMDLSKLEAGRMHLHVRPHNLDKYLRFVVSAFASIADRKRITLTRDVGDGDRIVYFDAHRLEQVINNLLSNAIKFTPEHGKVLVSVREVQEETRLSVEIMVRDTGPGIPSEAVPYVFDRFRQVDDIMAPHRSSTGIGLALAKELVDAHSGSIRAESEVGFGSTFIVLLPLGFEHFKPHDLVPASSDVAESTKSAEYDWESVGPGYFDRALEAVDEAPDHAPLILIVDDHADMREYLHRLLSSRYRIDEAQDGEEGLAVARRLSPDLIISDVMMPKLDGFALCRAVKTDEHLNHIPVILLTARAEREAEQKGLETGADDYIYKPFHAGLLLARVENLIEVRRHLRKQFSGSLVVQPSAVTVSSVDGEFLERVRATVEALMENSNFGVEWLADEVGVSARHLQRRLRSMSQPSASGFINMMRLQRAAQLLEQQSGTVSEIAYAVGFHDPGYFSKRFKQTFGVSPSAFKSRRVEG